MYQPKVEFVLQYKNKHFSFDAYSSSGSSQFTATLQLTASVSITHPPHSHRNSASAKSAIKRFYRQYGGAFSL